MGQILDEIKSYLGVDIQEPSETLAHYGKGHLDGGHSGRYEWGSGEDPHQHDNLDFLDRIDILKKNGWTETPENIMNEFGLTTTQYRTEKSNAKNERDTRIRTRIKELREDGKGWTEIGRILGKPESTIRSMLNEDAEKRTVKARETADFLKEMVDSKGMIDVGAGVEIELGVSKEKLKQALKLLEEEGYNTYSGGFDQVTNKGQRTTQTVLCPPGSKHSDIYDLENVHSLNDYTSDDGGQTFRKFEYPSSIDASRVKVRYADDTDSDGITGVQKDGIIELRRGVADLSLGDSIYSQVRIMVNGTHYLKGMAVYSDDMPDGVDIVFNTNKTPDKPMIDTTSEKMDKCVLKPIKSDPDNPFGSLIKANGQSYYDDPNGKYVDPITGKKQSLSLINKRADEGDWSEWADALPSQFLSKQSRTLAQKQLDIAKEDKLAEYDEICSITNPTIKKYWLNKFADECDSAAVHLKAAALPGQKYHVIIPINTLKDDEIYAPGYQDGTKLALVRYPHGGTFEIPICTVNNKNALGTKILGKAAVDAVGINSTVAGRLSGADFDGDTVMCIPTHNGKVKIVNREPLEDLIGFEPKTTYPERQGMKYMKDPKTGKDSTQMEMGKISNLITDMTLAGASEKELARAVKHSMVVIDAGKHKLDYKQSEADNHIKELINTYQRKIDPNTGEIKIGGASTLISRASGEKTVDKRQGSPWINLKSNEGKKSRDGVDLYDPTKPEGSLLYKTADDLHWEKTVVNARTGKTTVKEMTRHQKTTNMADTDDPYSLVSAERHQMELIYAQYATDMKTLANKARVTMSNTGKIAVSNAAKKTYAKEIKSIDEKLDVALINAPKEREAQRRANVEVTAKKKAYAEENNGAKMKPGDVKKASQQAISKYRTEVNSVARKKRSIVLTDKEWEAIQNGAVSENKLTKILNNADADELRSRSTPKNSKGLTDAQITRIKSMKNQGFTLEQIASKFNVSTSTISSAAKGDK